MGAFFETPVVCGQVGVVVVGEKQITAAFYHVNANGKRVPYREKLVKMPVEPAIVNAQIRSTVELVVSEVTTS